MNEKPKKGQI